MRGTVGTLSLTNFLALFVHERFTGYAYYTIRFRFFTALRRARNDSGNN